MKMNNNEGKYMNERQVSNHYENKELLKDLDLGELLKVKKLMSDIKIRK